MWVYESFSVITGVVVEIATPFFIGDSDAAAAFASEVNANTWLGLNLVAWFGPEAPL